MAGEKPLLNLDLLEKLEAKLKKWDKDNPDNHFKLWRFVRFAVLTGGAPYMAEEPYLSIWKRVADGRRKRKLQLFPRGHFKSYGAKVFGAFLFCEPDAHRWGPQVRLCVTGQTGKFAKRTVEGIRSMLETNKFIRDNYPTMKPSSKALKAIERNLTDRGISAEISKPMWRQDRFRTLPCVQSQAETGVVFEEPSCWAQGMDEATTGYHMDVVLMDDPVGRATWKSATKKETAREVYYDLQSQIMDGLIVILGTRWATDDIHATLIEEYFETVDINSSNVWGGGREWYKEHFRWNGERGRHDFLGNMEDVTLFFEGAGTIEEEIARGYRLPREERRAKTLEYIADKMHSYPNSVWTKQMLNRAHNAEDLVFQKEMFRHYSTDLMFGGMPTYILTDSATGKDSRSSYRVLAAVTIDAQDVAYCRTIQFGRWGPEEYMRRALQMYEQYEAGRMLMEQVAWQDAFKSTLDLICRMEGKRNPRVVMVTGRSEVSKFERIESLEPRLRAGRLLFNPELQELTYDNRNCWKEMIRQFLDCKDVEQSKGMILDIPDALSDIDSTDRDGGRLCRPAKRARSVPTPSLEQRVQGLMGSKRDRMRGLRSGNPHLRRPPSFGGR